MSLNNDGPVSLTNSLFEYNYCHGDGQTSTSIFSGGAIVLHTMFGQADISNCTFIENIAVSGIL